MRRDVAGTIIDFLRRAIGSIASKPRSDRRSSSGESAPSPKRPRSAPRPPQPSTRSNEPERRPRPADVHPGDHVVLPDTELDEVTIVYAPVRDGDPDPGEVVWTWVPFEDDPSQGKDRPVVVIGRDGEHLAGVQLSSKRHGERNDYLPMGSGPWDPQGRESYAKIERILRIEPDAVRREGAVLDKHRFDQLVSALRQYHRVGFG